MLDNVWPGKGSRVLLCANVPLYLGKYLNNIVWDIHSKSMVCPSKPAGHEEAPRVTMGVVWVG